MNRQRNVVFLQLPQLDNDVTGPSENLPMAAAYLEHAARQSAQAHHYRFLKLNSSHDADDTPALTRALLALRPDIIAATLYLWNIEWTLRLLRNIKTLQPSLQVIVGGPEVARRHPFLYRSGIPDVAVSGEGESVFPVILDCLRRGRTIDFSTVAWKTRQGYAWGHTPPPPVILAEALPPVTDPACAPDQHGMAYLETSRGCPMRCTYCRYAHLRRGISFLAPEAVADRVRSLRALGAREIRFVDPTFNAHPRFQDILRELADVNRDHRIRFFAELMADRLTPEHARLLAAANFTDIEVGMQSRDPHVLREIRRPTRLDRLDNGLRLLSRHRITVTLDVMYALPRQTLPGLRRTIQWSLRQPRTNVQCLQTLLLPGTELRHRRREWNCQALTRPPYAVTSTDSLSPADLVRTEALIANHPRLRSDTRTHQFVGRTLPGLFKEQVPLDALSLPAHDIPGSRNRRTYLIRGTGLYQQRTALARFVRRCIRTQPDGLFQFVLIPQYAEPLDLLDDLIAVIRKAPPHLVDRYASVMATSRVASRRLRILLPPHRRFEDDWIRAAEELLSGTFF
jgi:uncharacterized Fe-S cluster-containing radical SAM superfamily protein